MPLKHVQQDPTELAPLEKIFSTLGIEGKIPTLENKPSETCSDAGAKPEL